MPPQGPITRARAKAFKDSISALVAQFWDETQPSRSEEAYINSSSSPRNLLLVQIQLMSSSPAQVQLTSLNLAWI
ncbi:hypothetical protein PVK06_040213 [Gossypium arboreum]|uniref:Uncharacterized protein n=1 Tax=Gossypium arboreum TaxID=29729 RepID=A0ABR0N4U8_GOSAR|nr:hypothetical protein PVK06_040213 [Gossypium arboreum]